MPEEQVVQTATGLEYVEILEGTGAQPKAGDSVSVHYTAGSRADRSSTPRMIEGSRWSFSSGVVA